MRCDVFLKTSCIVKRRTLAKQLFDNNRVMINGVKAKAGRDIKMNDVLCIEFPSKTMTIKVIDIPQMKNVSKTVAKELYEIVSIEPTAHD